MNRWLARGGQAYAAGVRTHKVRVAVAAMVAYDAAPHPQHGEKPALMVQTLAKRLLARIKSDAGAGAEGAESLLERLQPLGDVRQANAELLSKVAALEAELKALKARRGWNNSAAHTIAPYNCCAHFVPAGWVPVSPASLIPPSKMPPPPLDATAVAERWADEPAGDDDVPPPTAHARALDEGRR